MTGRSRNVPIAPESRQRLARLMDERRRDLRLRWQDVAEAGDLSLKTLHSVRNGVAGIAPLTQRGIEVGLQWETGSVGTILGGGDPVEVKPEAPDAEAEVIALPSTDDAVRKVLAVQRILGRAIDPDDHGEQAMLRLPEPPERIAALILQLDKYREEESRNHDSGRQRR